MLRQLLCVAVMMGFSQPLWGQDAKEAPAPPEVFSGPQVGETLAALTQLEWSGAVDTLPGQRWVRRAAARR